MRTFESSNMAESTLIRSGPGGIHTAVLAAGSDTATLILYNNTAGSGTILCKLSAVANTTETISCLDIPCSIGLYAALTGTAANASVSYW